MRLKIAPAASAARYCHALQPLSVYGFVWNDAHGMVPLAYLLGLVGMFFTAISYAAMSRAFPVANSVYSYAQRSQSQVAASSPAG
jgi:amino acid transporter